MINDDWSRRHPLGRGWARWGPRQSGSASRLDSTNAYRTDSELREGRARLACLPATSVHANASPALPPSLPPSLPAEVPNCRMPNVDAPEAEGLSSRPELSMYSILLYTMAIYYTYANDGASTPAPTPRRASERAGERARRAAATQVAARTPKRRSRRAKGKACKWKWRGHARVL